MDAYRQQLEQLLVTASTDAVATAMARLQHRVADLEEREAALAAAMELANVDGAVRAAFHDGRMEERDRVLKLIDTQLDMLSRTSISRTLLHALRRMVEGQQQG